MPFDAAGARKTRADEIAGQVVNRFEPLTLPQRKLSRGASRLDLPSGQRHDVLGLWTQASEMDGALGEALTHLRWQLDLEELMGQAADPATIAAAMAISFGHPEAPDWRVLLVDRPETIHQSGAGYQGVMFVAPSQPQLNRFVGVRAQPDPSFNLYRADVWTRQPAGVVMTERREQERPDLNETRGRLDVTTRPLLLDPRTTYYRVENGDIVDAHPSPEERLDWFKVAA